ncbi:MAG: hypothetical protein H0Z33_02810 [Bacillaceae bacterium]|nr:hypothetical protein [Bacillaceae bacterium]
MMLITGKRVLWTVLFFLMISGFYPFALSAEDVEIELPDGEKVQVSREPVGNGYKYRVKFADGETYTYTRTGVVETSGGSQGLTREQMDKAETAINIYRKMFGQEPVKEEPSGNPFAFLFFVMGILGVFSPRTMWFLEIGWKLKDTEPSDLALMANRVVGVFLILMGLALTFS